MKAKISFFLILLFASSLCLAQVNVGLKGGVNASTFFGADADAFEGRSSAMGGAFLNLSRGGLLALQPELLFSQKGAYHTEPYSYDLSIRYVEVPVLFKFHIPVTARFYPNVFIGPYVAYKRRSSTLNAQRFEASDPRPVTDIKTMDYGGLVGAGIDIIGEKFFFTADGRYGLGLNTIHNLQTGDGMAASRDLKNACFTISAGIGYSF